MSAIMHDDIGGGFVEPYKAGKLTQGIMPNQCPWIEVGDTITIKKSEHDRLLEIERDYHQLQADIHRRTVEGVK